MFLKRAVAAAGLLAASAACQAGVVYEWVTVTNGMPMPDPVIRFEIAQGVVRSGSFQLTVPIGETTIPKTGLEMFFYEQTNVPHSWFPTEAGYMDIHLSFVHNNFFAVGWISYMDFSSLLMTGSHVDPADNRLWRIEKALGDNILGCNIYTVENYCSGATGYFRQVPEPASITLLGVGVLAAFASRRRRNPA